MSKMGQELDGRLDENKYELYETLKEMVDANREEEPAARNMMLDAIMQRKADVVLAKIEGK